MARLAIRGHATRGKEVIEILEMLGGKIRRGRFVGHEIVCGYYINEDGYIGFKHYSLFDDTTIFTLEEFLEKYPYKIGDKVKAWVDEYYGIFDIQDMGWADIANEVRYKIKGYWYSVRNLQPYKEETMETITIDDFKANTKEWLIDKLYGMIINDAIKTICDIHNELHKPKYPKTYKECCDVLGLNTKEETMEDKLIPRIDLAGYCKDKYIIDLGNYEIKQENGKTYAVRKQPKYTQTCEECLNVLSKTMRSLDNMNGYKFGTLMHFQQLLICRDAYWKIAGEQMGLGKPWKPDWNKNDQFKNVLICRSNNIIKYAYAALNTILAFPTEEMRDTFYENFKDLIEECKEFL